MDNSIFDPQAQLDRPNFKIIASLERLSEAFRVLLWEQAKTLGVSPIQIQILIFLRFHSEEKRKVGYLAQEFSLTKATISEAVKSLEQKSLLSRQPDPIDTRSHSLHLTENGLAMAEQTAFFANPMLKALTRITPKEQGDLLQNLLGIVSQLQNAGIVSIQRMCFSCRFYRKNNDGHFCQFMNKPLISNELRVDCAEFERAV